MKKALPIIIGILAVLCGVLMLMFLNKRMESSRPVPVEKLTVPATKPESPTATEATQSMAPAKKSDSGFAAVWL